MISLSFSRKNHFSDDQQKIKSHFGNRIKPPLFNLKIISNKAKIAQL